MDINAKLRLLMRAIADGEWDDAQDHLDEMRAWHSKGGNLPTVRKADRQVSS